MNWSKMRRQPRRPRPDPVELIHGGPSSFVPIAQALAVPRQTSQRPDRTIQVYAIAGAGDRVVYVGVTRKRLKDRLQQHREEPTNDRMRAWFRELGCGRGRHAKPKIYLLEYVSEAEWEDAERGWIHWFRERGTLLNVDRGGKARDRFGRLRPFRPGEYAPPTGSGVAAPKPIDVRAMPINDDDDGGFGARDRFFRAAAFVPRQQALQSPTKARVAGQMGEAVIIRRPSHRAVEASLGTGADSSRGMAGLAAEPKTSA